MTTEAFREWLEGWWKNPRPIDPISRSNVFDAYLAGVDEGVRQAREAVASGVVVAYDDTFFDHGSNSALTQALAAIDGL